MISKKEKITHSKNSDNTLKLVKNKRINSNGKKGNNNIKISKEKNKQKDKIKIKEKNMNKIDIHNLCESSENIILLMLIIYLKQNIII